MKTKPKKTHRPDRSVSRADRRQMATAMRAKLRVLESLANRWIDLHAALKHDPRYKLTGAAALLKPAARVTRVLADVIDTGDCLLAALKNPDSSRIEQEQSEHLFARDGARFRGALIDFADAQLIWRLRAARWKRLTPLINKRGETLYVDDLAPGEFLWMSERRRAFFSKAKSQFHDFGELRRQYLRLANILADYTGPDLADARALAADISAILPTLKAATRALFRILDLLYDADVTDREVQRLVLANSTPFLRIDRESLCLAKSISTWLANHPPTVRA